MSDHLVIATAFNDTVRIYAAVTTDLVEKARQIHNTWPTATAAFGRLVTAAVMMGGMNDNLIRLTIEVKGDGPLGKILAVSNQRGVVKGDIDHPQVDLELNSRGKLNVSAAVGSGYLTVIKDIGLKEPYQGVVELQNSEIGEDIAYYFVTSEQTPAAVALGVLVNPDGTVRTAGGFIIQLMPGANTDLIAELETHLSSMPSVTSQLDQGVSPRQMIESIIGTTDVKYLDEQNVFYNCDCSQERFRGPLLSLGSHELAEIFREQGQIEVVCHFCKKVYHFAAEQLLDEL